MVRDKIRRFETPFQIMAIQAISSAAALRKAHTAFEASIYLHRIDNLQCD